MSTGTHEPTLYTQQAGNNAQTTINSIAERRQESRLTIYMYGRRNGKKTKHMRREQPLQALGLKNEKHAPKLHDRGPKARTKYLDL